jgi:Uma2 family endonuclease
LYTYPDVVALCDEMQFDDLRRDTLINPAVIIEVLSLSTEAYDRGDKFAHYRRLESVNDYVLVSQTQPRVEHYVRDSNRADRWVLTEVDGLDSMLSLASIGCEIAMSDIYDKVDFETAPAELKTDDHQ